MAKIKFKIYFIFLGMMVFCLLPYLAFCDILRLKEIPEGEDGNEVEILEEREDSFIIKVSKGEIEAIKRKRPTDVELWREKRILWEDTGDYITLYLPKEKIVLPEGYTGEEYNSAKALQQELKYTADEGRTKEATFWKGTGRIIGRILNQGEAVDRAKVKIVNVSPQMNTLSRLLGPGDIKPQDLVFETVTDELGRYEFRNIPLGEYDIYWLVPGADSWYRRLSEKPDIAVRPGETVEYRDIEVK